MELENLKSAWKNIPGKNKNEAALKQMLSENRHPVLKGIRLQLLIEITAWVFFLFAYYDMFDGDQKPLASNLLLVVAVLLLLVHSISGYLASRRPVKAGNLKESLKRYLSNIKLYAVVSVASRVFAIACLLAFFIATITFTANKYLMLGGIILIIPLQVYFLSRIWLKRIKKLETAIIGLSEN